jgi:hypothetical protein
LHHVSVGVGQHEGRPDAAGGPDRAEQIDVVVALVGGLAWPRSAPGPLPNLAVLLADAGLAPVKTGARALYDGRATDLEADCCGLGIVVSAASAA